MKTKYAYWLCGLYWHVGYVDRYGRKGKILYSYQTEREARACMHGFYLRENH